MDDAAPIESKSPPLGQAELDILTDKLIEKLLSDGRTFLTGETFATVDAYLFTVTNWAGTTKVDLSAFPNVQAYQKRVAARPAVQASLVAEGLVKAA